MGSMASPTMRAMLLARPGAPLQLARLPRPVASPGQLQIQIEACGVCRTDLHLVDGELPDPCLPIVPGHEIVGKITAIGKGVEGFSLNERVGVPWLGWTCGKCQFCLKNKENLCESARFTGYHINGGFAEYTVADARYCFTLKDLPAQQSSAQLAPLLCAGLIGYRALRFADDAQRIGLYGFGAAAHLISQVLRAQERPFFAFTRPGDTDSQQFAMRLGATWAGGSNQSPPTRLDAAILFAPSGELVPLALRRLDKGGCVICAGIHMSDIPAFPYADLWGERVIRSVANLTRDDGIEFLECAKKFTIQSVVTSFSLERANDAIEYLRSGALQGAAVLKLVPDF